MKILGHCERQSLQSGDCRSGWFTVPHVKPSYSLGPSSRIPNVGFWSKGGVCVRCRLEWAKDASRASSQVKVRPCTVHVSAMS